MKDINEVMLNPVRMRIIQTLAVNKSMTTTEICEIINDVPRTTLYRHIKLLLDNSILTVISEQKIRGVCERTLALNLEAISSQNKVIDPLNQIFSFLMNTYSQFQKYLSSEDADTGRDMVFCNNTVLMATNEEYNDFLRELSTLLQKYSIADYKQGRKSRNLSILSVMDTK